VPVVDHERPRGERGGDARGGGDDAGRAHRAFQDPHSLHRGTAPANDSERDCGQQVVRRGPSGLVKNAKGQWVKPDSKPSAADTSAAGEPGEPQRFIPERQWKGQRLYYFAMGRGVLSTFGFSTIILQSKHAQLMATARELQ
jgi:hypothetical protein